MTDKHMLDNIPIHDKLDEYIELGFEKGRKEESLKKSKLKKTFIAMVASFTIVISSISIIGLDKVEAAIKQVLQYVPGYNVMIDKDEGKVLALQEQVFYKKDDTFVRITAASKLDSKLYLSVQSNTNNLEVLLKDEKSDIISPNSWSKAGGGEFWQGDYVFQVEGEYRNYKLLLGDLEIPFTLENTTEVEDFLQLGSFAQDKGISVVALKRYMEDKIIISLLNKSEGKLVVDYPFEENLMFSTWDSTLNIEKTMYLMDKEGNKIYPTIPSSFGSLMSDFYFDTIDKEGLKLVLPYIKVSYPNVKTEKVKIRTPKDGEVESINKVLHLDKFDINIIDVRNEEKEIVISFKIISTEDEILDDVKIRGISGYGLGQNQETGYTELFISKEEAGKRFSICFESPTSLLLGNWEIDLE